MKEHTGFLAVYPGIFGFLVPNDDRREIKIAVKQKI